MIQPRTDKKPNPHEDCFECIFRKMDSADTGIVADSGNQKKWFIVDPFVDMAANYHQRKSLLGKRYMVKGYWFLSYEDVFIVNQDGLSEVKQ